MIELIYNSELSGRKGTLLTSRVYLGLYSIEISEVLSFTGLLRNVVRVV